MLYKFPRSPVAAGLAAMQPGDNFIFAEKDRGIVIGIIQSEGFRVGTIGRKFPIRSHPIGIEVTCKELPRWH